MACLRVHPGNRKLFEFRGKPRVLLCATEHYGSVMNRPFDFEKYLRAAAAEGQTLTRLFALFREQQSVVNPYSSLKVESPEYVAPYARTGPGRATDGQPQYDLDKWNGEYFERLHRFLELSGTLGVCVELVLFSNTYGGGVWALHPLCPANHANDWGEIPWADYMTQRHAALFGRQCAFVRKMVAETNRYEHIMYEVCNEPGGGLGGTHPTVDDVNAWLAALAKVIRETEAGLSNRHLVVGQEAFAYRDDARDAKRAGPDVFQFADASFDGDVFDVVNMHPLSNMVYREKFYDLGQFMEAKLRLKAFRQYCLDAYGEHKPLNMDEDNCATQYKDVHGWTMHRKRAWVAALCGAHYDMIDFTIWPHVEEGSPEARRCLRAWFGHLARFVHQMDLVNARPMPGLVSGLPEELVAAAYGVAGKEYAVYVADAREREAGVGTPVRAELKLDLPAGAFEMRLYSPVTGEYSPAVAVGEARPAVVRLPAVEHDVVVQIATC